MQTATVRDIRNHFPKVKAIVEAHGEVIVTDNGEPKYRLTLYSPPGVQKRRRKAKDYMSRLRTFQQRPMNRAAAKALEDENRGGR
jgi:antitoxin (DNA-binding transcriptional repressor) of toxin-antitoxin stability system